MLNKRKLIKIFLSELHSERPYIDFKQELNINSEKDKAKIAKYISAFINTNKKNNSYLIFGIEDKTKKIFGCSHIDDYQIQQIVTEYLSPIPKVLYENIPYPDVGSNKAIGLLTINPMESECEITKRIWKLEKGSKFTRYGSMIKKYSILNSSIRNDNYSKEIQSIERRASVNFKETIDDIVKFYKNSNSEYHPKHCVFNDLKIVLYSGWEDEYHTDFLSEVNVELVPDGVRLFWGALQYVKIVPSKHSFSIKEFKMLFWNKKPVMVPLEETIFIFYPNGEYSQKKEYLFQPPPVKQQDINKLIKRYIQLFKKYKSKNNRESEDTDFFNELEILPYELLIAVLNGSEKSKKYLDNFFEGEYDGALAESYFDAMNTLNTLKKRTLNTTKE